MKKVLSFVAIAAMTAFVVSCGNDDAQRKADSTKQADSLHAIEVANQAKMDSAHNADSTKAAADAAKAKRVADSTHMADSLAKVKGKPKPKTVQQQIKEENKKATGGRGK
jgi:folylpolyglutamate synthase/dihydropteroate synthase